MEDAPPDAELTTAQVAEILGISVPTVVKRADSGQLPCRLTEGGQRRFPEKAIRALAGPRGYLAAARDELTAVRAGIDRVLTCIDSALETQRRPVSTPLIPAAPPSEKARARAARRARVAELRAQGLPLEEIAEKLDLSFSTVQRDWALAQQEQAGLYTTPKVAEMAGVDVAQVREWVDEGRLPVHSRNKRGNRLYAKDDVEALLRELGVQVAG